MSIIKFPAAVAAAFPVAPRAPAQTETRLPEVGVTASLDEAQGYTALARRTFCQFLDGVDHAICT